MKFLSFSSQEERSRFSGTGFIEIQYCRPESTANIKQLVAVSNINNWENDSLYICDDDINMFYSEYQYIFNCGIYNNLKSGVFDTFGINYYRPDLIEPIIHKLQKLQPADYKVLIAWLIKAQKYNGFYILGI